MGMVHLCNLNTKEIEAGESRICCQPGLYETLKRTNDIVITVLLRHKSSNYFPQAKHYKTHLNHLWAFM